MIMWLEWNCYGNCYNGKVGHGYLGQSENIYEYLCYVNVGHGDLGQNDLVVPRNRIRKYLLVTYQSFRVHVVLRIFRLTN